MSAGVVEQIVSIIDILFSFYYLVFFVIFKPLNSIRKNQTDVNQQRLSQLENDNEQRRNTVRIDNTTKKEQLSIDI
jgi:hypothetical protein